MTQRGPAGLNPVLQRNGPDCAVAAMATRFGASYEEVRAILKYKQGRTDSRGTIKQQEIDCARHFGFELTWVDEDEFGIKVGWADIPPMSLVVAHAPRQRRNAHMMYSDKDGKVWEVGTKAKQGKYRLIGYYEVEKIFDYKEKNKDVLEQFM
jgi:hypothetical protein